MVFVILGTQDKSFKRLLEYVDRSIEKGIIKDEVIAQIGQTNYSSKNMKIFKLLPMDDFKKYINECDLIITHGGVGAILDGLKASKKIIAVPRLKMYGEHVNDHQVQIINEFSNMGYILPCYDLENLDDTILKIKDFKPKKYMSNNKEFVKLITDYIDKM